uniref:Uncharacterized protein n=1 Tax=Setaria digitata TaxID=48799 RepID=A0A915PJ90_9BILA
MRAGIVSSIVVERCPVREDEQGKGKSQQFMSPQKEPTGFLRRTFSFQVGKTKELFTLDSETSAMIKLRYKDTSKHVIWRDCALPEEYNRGCLTLKSDHSKCTAIRYNHAGNHQAKVLRLKDGEVAGNVAIGPFDSPKTFPRAKHQKQQPFCTVYPVRMLPSTSPNKIENEKQPKRATSLDPETKSNGAVVDIEDDQTPILKRVINSIRRSESSDEDEPIVSLTAPKMQDESGFFEGDVVSQDDIEADLQIWRL